MIRVDRSAMPRPPSLDLNDPDSAASIELQKVRDHFADPENHPKPKYAAYNSDEVRLALFQLFHGKCAYCETKVNAGNAQDVEHFRPKGRIDPCDGNPPIVPGYYWLAMEWDNLLLACKGCNQRLRQRTMNEDDEYVYEDTARGKLDRFPLEQGTPRAQDAGDPVIDSVAVEEPGRLLLNPCLDDPEKYLRYDREGNILPRVKNGQKRPEAVESIETYALARFDLTTERQERFLDMVDIEDDIQDAAEMVQELDARQKRFVAAAVRSLEGILDRFADGSRPFAGICRWHTRKHRSKLRKIRRQYEQRFGEEIPE